MNLVQLYAEMAALTKPKCGECRVPHQCCNPEQCEFTARLAADSGVMLNRTSHPRLPFMGEDGCVVAPHLRPICSVHVCENHLWDLGFSEKYFKLRDAICEAEYEQEGNHVNGMV
jgi:hypothetical protein